MRKLISILTSLCLLGSLTACTNNETNTESVDGHQVITEDPALNSIECKYFDVESGTFTDETIISLNVPQNYTITDQGQLLHQKPIYQIGEFKSDKKLISVFQYSDHIDFNELIKINNEWYIGDSNEENMVNLYTKKEKAVIGISITNLDKSELDFETAVAALSILTQTEMTVPENPISERESDYAEASVEKPAKVGEWISIRMFNPVSGKDEAILYSLSSVKVDNANSSVIDAYNRDGELKSRNNEIEKFIMHSKAFSSGYDDIIYTYSIYYPSSWTSEDGIVKDPVIPISLCNGDDSSVIIDGEMTLNDTIHDFNDLYQKTAIVGEDYTGGLGTYAMVRNINLKKYLIKIETADGPRYFTPTL